MAENEEEVVIKQKGSNIVLIMVIVLLLVILIIGSLIIYLLASNNPDEAAAAGTNTAIVQENGKKKPAEKQHESANLEVGTMYPLESFTVNLASEGGTKYLKTTMQLEQNIPELTPELDKKRPLIVDSILTTLSSKSYEEISTNRGKKRLKEELIENINKLLNDGFIKNIYITEFVIS